jgi:hypothetical protein
MSICNSSNGRSEKHSGNAITKECSSNALISQSVSLNQIIAEPGEDSRMKNPVDENERLIKPLW